MIFRMRGVDTNTFLALDPVEIDRKILEAHRSGAFYFRDITSILSYAERTRGVMQHDENHPPDGSVPLGTSSDDMTFAEIEGRVQARSYAKFLRERVPGFSHSYLVATEHIFYHRSMRLSTRWQMR